MKHVLIASIGGAPQVVTETLWAMMHPRKLLSADNKQRDPVVPDEIIMLTTAFKGLGNSFRSKDERLKTTRDKIYELYAQYGHQKPKINPLRSQVVRDQGGHEIDDIRDHVQNAAFADAVVAVMTRLKERRKKEDLTLHISLAGGRKTMSSYLHWAMITFGTEQDELTHVLIENTHLEAAPDFWWPNQQQEKVFSRSANTELSTDAQMDAEGNLGDSARLDLVRVPFDPLGRTIPDIDQRYASFADLVAYQRWDRERLPVIFHRKSRSITVAGQELNFRDEAFAVLFVSAMARKEEWTSPFDNQIEGLKGRILAQDIRYGLDHFVGPKESKARDEAGSLFDFWWEEIPYAERLQDDQPANFVSKSASNAPPQDGEDEKRTPFDAALYDLNRQLKVYAKSYYLPAALTIIKQKVSRKKIVLDYDVKVSTTHFGFDFDKDRIEFRDD